MKKKVIKRKYRELPKYALGTMKPIDLGYQPGRGIGSAQMTTEPGVSLDPETQAIRQNALPKALNYAQMQVPFITETLKNNTSNTATTTSGTIASNAVTGSSASTLPVKNLNIAAQLPKTSPWSMPAAATAGTQTVIDTTGSTVSNAINGSGFSYNFSDETLNALKEYVAGEEAVKSGAKSAGTSALGTAMGAVGTTLGAYTMMNQIADFGSHRTAKDMQTNMGRQSYTTDKGNTYNAYIGPNLGQELAYENAQAKSKQLGFGVNAIGTGASLGGMLASAGALGSIGGPLGTALGAGVGLLLGGLGSLFGWGDNEEEVKKEARMLADNVSAYNRQQRAVAESKDTAAEFNDRVGTAALGKEEGGNMGKRLNVDANKLQPVFGEEGWEIDYPGSMVMPGELIINGKGKNRKYAMVPKTGNKKDDSTDSIPSKTRPGDPRIVVRQDLAPQVKNVLDGNYPENFKDWYVAQAENLQSEERYNNMKKYKNGKLPGFVGGKDIPDEYKGSWLDYAFPSAANIFSLIGLNSERNRVKNATFPMYPGVPENPGATRAIDILGRRVFDPRQLFEHIHKAYRNVAYNINRTSGIGAGGQTVARLANAHGESEDKEKAALHANEINNQYIADYANAIRDYGNRMQDLMVANNAQRMSLWQQQNAAKENWLADNTRSMSNMFGAWMKDLLAGSQYHQSLAFNNKMLGLYKQNLGLEQQKVLNDYNQTQWNNKFLREQADRELALTKESLEKQSDLFKRRFYRTDYRSILDPKNRLTYGTWNPTFSLFN